MAELSKGKSQRNPPRHQTEQQLVRRRALAQTQCVEPHGKRKSRAQYIAGLMSGTSADGIDAVVAELQGSERGLRARVVAHTHEPFAARLRRQILRVCLRGTVDQVCELNFVLGQQFARAALAVIRKAKLSPADVAAIGSHGQTIHHLPNARTPSTLQIGEPSVIAEQTGITTVADFRVRDMAAGGQGAPLVAYADWALFTHNARPRIVQNIGGIANLTFLPPGAELEEVLAFDTGPGNMVIDAVATVLSGGRRSFDKDGRWADRGQVSEKLLAQLMAHPFLRRPPPKTTGREEFGEPFVRRLLASARRMRLRGEDIVATVTAFTAASIADAWVRFVFPALKANDGSKVEVILGGGGAKNQTLWRMLSESRPVGMRTTILRRAAMRPNEIQILTHEDFGIANSAKEALAFAILAYETLHGRASNVPQATGARHRVVLGKILPESI